MGSTRDKPKRAVRKTVKWGGAGLTVLLVVVWIGSGWVGVTWTWPDGGQVLAIEGYMQILPPLGGPRNGPPFAIYLRQQRFHLGSACNWGPTSIGWVAIFPLWPAALLSLLATAAAWRADLKHIRRARAGLCGSCGYDRAGLVAGAVCPECGAAPSV